MHQIIRSPKARQPSPAFARKAAFRQPHYDCQERTDALEFSSMCPAWTRLASTSKCAEPDLIVTAPKSHLVRANWRALHLEPVQRDYRLCLRLGFSLDYDALRAELHDSVLTITIPKKAAVAAAGAAA